MFIVYWHQQKNREISVLLAAYFFCLFNDAAKNFQSFGVKNYLRTYNHVDACCLMTSSEQKYLFLF